MFPKQPQRSKPRGIGTRLFHDPKAVDAVLTWPRWNGCRWLHGILIGAAENTLRCSCLKKMFEEDNVSSDLSKGKTDLAVADAWIHIFVSLQDIFFGILHSIVMWVSALQSKHLESLFGTSQAFIGTPNRQIIAPNSGNPSMVVSSHRVLWGPVEITGRTFWGNALGCWILWNILFPAFPIEFDMQKINKTTLVVVFIRIYIKFKDMGSILFTYQTVPKIEAFTVLQLEVEFSTNC